MDTLILMGAAMVSVTAGAVASIYDRKALSEWLGLLTAGLALGCLATMIW